MNRVVVENCSKKFAIGTQTKEGVLSQIANLFSGKEKKRTFWALQNISFTVKAGEALGIVGPNGAGKSTLLSVIAGVYQTTSGTITTHGKVVSIIGLTQGLRDRLTMRDNIYLCCSLFGLKNKTIKQCLDSIVSLATLEEYVDTKLYQFSSGMLGRLVFSIALHCDPEILLLDEASNFLDQEFINILAEHVNSLQKNGTSILAASHNMDAIESCNNALWLNKGNQMMLGPSNLVIQSYSQNHL